MSKYYNKEIPTEINIVYGSRHSGKNYYEFNKIKNGSVIEDNYKELYNHYKDLMNDYTELFCDYSELRQRIYKAIEYIEELYARYIADYSDIERLEKILKGEENEN